MMFSSGATDVMRQTHLARRLDGLEMVALFMDGVVVAQQTVIVVLGITRAGGKGPARLAAGLDGERRGLAELPDQLPSSSSKR